MEWVHIDYLTVKANEAGKDVNILVVTNHSTCYLQAITTSTQTAKCTTQNLWDKFIVHYGFLEWFWQIKDTTLRVICCENLCELAQVKKVRRLGYHPQANGQCKCFNTTLINMLGTLPEKPKSSWREHIPTLVHAYNCTRNNVTDFSLYYLMFGRKPCLPIDIIFGTNTAELKGNTSTKYIENLNRGLQWAYKTVNKVVKREQEEINDITIKKSDVHNWGRW